MSCVTTLNTRAPAFMKTVTSDNGKVSRPTIFCMPKIWTNTNARQMRLRSKGAIRRRKANCGSLPQCFSFVARRRKNIYTVKS